MGGPRVKFKVERVGDIPGAVKANPSFIGLAGELADALVELERAGCMPILPDGLVGGNAAFIVTHEHLTDTPLEGYGTVLVVTKSGKPAHHRPSIDQGDFVIVVGFDRQEWRVHYLSMTPAEKPTSDTPLLYAALMNNGTGEGEGKEAVGHKDHIMPRVAIHGHMFSSEADALLNGLPISKHETLFSTPEDLTALEELTEAYPYPEYRVYIRKGHGFFSVGMTVEEAMDNVRRLKRADKGETG